MTLKTRWQIILIGLLTGFILNYYFKLIEWITDKKVYTLLLNVDYFPILKNYDFPEWIEIGLHLIVSLVLAGTYTYLWRKWKRPFLWTVVSAFIIGLLIYPTTGFSARTPEVNDYVALFWWQTGHLIYGFTLAWLIQRFNKS